MSMTERFDDGDDELLREFRPVLDNKEEKFIMSQKDLERVFSIILADMASDNPDLSAALRRMCSKKREENQ